MIIITNKKIDMMIDYGKQTDCLVHCIHIKVLNVNLHSKEMIKSIADKSWITTLDIYDQAAYEACANKTIEKLVSSIFSKIKDTVTEDFGEYLISHVAQKLLVNTFQHVKVPLAELFKEKLSNNMGFDFHTESMGSNIIVYGEAKFSSQSSPYTKAFTQIINFINEEKDMGELLHVRKFVSQNAADNMLNKKKGYVAAFSINAKDPTIVLQNALKSGELDKLLVYSELYLIGVEIDAKISN